MSPTTTDAASGAARAELEAVLASSTFARARSLSHLLRYLCEKQFGGEADQLKEYTIAVEAYGRPADFQQKENSIIRVEMKRLRDKLKQFYEHEGAGHGLQILIPVGQYAPVFSPRPVVAEEVHAPAGEGPTAPALPDFGETGSGVKEARTDAGATQGGRPRSAGSGRWGWMGVAVLAAGALFAAIRFWQPTGARARAAAAIEAPAGGAGAAAAIPADEVRILAGAQVAKYIDRAGKVWSGDRFYTGGNPLSTLKPFIYRTRDPEIYHSGRQGDFTYDVPLKPGDYELRLHFAETFFGPDMMEGGGETSRLFAVMANGRPLLKPIDIISEAGGSRTAEVKVFKNIRPAADGILHLQFYSWTHGKALLNALEVLPAPPYAIRPVRFTAHDKPVYTADGREWLPDNYFKGGRTLTRGGALTGTTEPELYQAERFGHFTYAIPVAAGRYRVKLHFAERYFGPSNPSPAGKGVGSRVFHVFCNGEALLRNFDIFHEAGGMDRAVTRTFDGLTPDAQGKLLLEFRPVTNYALVNAIEVTDEAWK